jgi:hypothetical protein
MNTAAAERFCQRIVINPGIMEGRWVKIGHHSQNLPRGKVSNFSDESLYFSMAKISISKILNWLIITVHNMSCRR